MVPLPLVATFLVLGSTMGTPATTSSSSFTPVTPMVPPGSDGSNLTLLVSKGIGMHGYNSIRLSVVNKDRSSPSADGLFTYNEQFKYRWTQFALHSALVNVSEGPNKFTIGGQQITVSLPPKGKGVKGMIFGDPCTESNGIIGCLHFNGSTPSMKDRIPRLVNAVSPDTDFRVILGDNFYDLDGNITERFFDAVTTEAKQVIQLTVPGNHDYWWRGDPLLKDKKDQHGNGFMQWYGQDSLASKVDPVSFLDFSNDPDASHHPLAASSNFFYYNNIGNVGFLGYSGAYERKEYEKSFEEACSFFEEAKPGVIMLLGHWVFPLLGCPPEMDVPAVHKYIKKFPGCNHGNVRYAMGHWHCNDVKDEGDGYLLGGTGMKGGGCDQFGFAYMDTTNGRELVYHFSLANKTEDLYEEMVSCFEAKGVEACAHYGNVWHNSSLPTF